jgi:hypothetical protein
VKGDIKLIYENYLKTLKSQDNTLKTIKSTCPNNQILITKDELISMLKFVEKHLNEYDAIADSTGYNMKQMLLEKINN